MSFLEAPALPQDRFMMTTVAVMLSPQGQNFGLGLVALASASLSYYVIGHFSGKNRVKFGNFVNFPAIILNRMLLIVI